MFFPSDERHRSARRRAGRGLGLAVLRVAVLAAVLVALLVAGCAKKEPIVGPEPVIPGGVRVEGDRVVWSTDGNARASVRYGSTRGSWDHMAYPDAVGRGDRALGRAHSVALLDLQPGRKVYFQTVSEVTGAPTAYTLLDSFVATTGPADGQLVATMIHIGFGDSHLLTLPTAGKHFLIDSGSRPAESSVVTYLNSHGVTALDAIEATHVHEDHLGGIVGSRGSTTDGVVNDFPPPLFFDSAAKSSNSLAKPAYQELLQSIPAGTSRIVLHRGDSSLNTPALALDPQVFILCLNSGTPPGYVPVGYETTDINNESIVLKLSYGDVDLILGGDASTASEGNMLAAFPLSTLEVEYFKATHHGLSSANSNSWVNALKPRVAFIPNSQLVWDPPEDLPGAIAATVSKLQAVGAHIYAIDEARTLERQRSSHRPYNVSFVTDGRSYEVRVETANQAVPALMAQSFEDHAPEPHAHAAEAPAGAP